MITENTTGGGRQLEVVAEGRYSRFVAENGRLALSWAFNATQQTVTFEVDCESLAWCSFGLSLAGEFHQRGECVTVWVDSDGAVQILEGNSYQQNQPISRVGEAVYMLEGGGEVAGRTTARVTRPYASDAEDSVAVRNGVQKVFWALRGGNTVPTGGFYAKHTARGSFTANLLNPSVPFGTGEAVDTNPGTEFVVAVVSLLSILAMLKLWWRLNKTAHTHLEPIPHNAEDGGFALATAGPEFERSQAPSQGSTLSSYRHKSHHSGIRLKLMVFSRRRLPRSEVTVLQFCVLSLMVLLMLLFVYPLRQADWPVPKGWGTMCSALAFMAVVPATRNSALTWLLNQPFEQTLFYHRAMGRLTVLTGFMHTLYFAFEWGTDFWTITFASTKYTEGLVALAALFVIWLTSLDAVRRRVYHHFKTLHFSFLLFFIFASLHSTFFIPFAIAALVVYGIDLVMREVFGLVPQRLLAMEPLPDGVVCLRFPKNRFTTYRPGQYIFINIPAVSLVQWHPFTVSSGIYEDHLSVHMKGLGKDGSWTKRVGIMANKLEQARLEDGKTHGEDTADAAAEASMDGENAPKQLPLIRVDGPYGRISFSYKRYESVVVLGGGIGVTPMLSILKELFRYANNEEPRPGAFSPLVKRVHCVFAIRHAKSWQWFFDEISSVVRRSGQRVPGPKNRRFPQLFVHGFVSSPLPTDNLVQVKADMTSLQEVDLEGVGGKPAVVDIVRGRPDCNIVLASVEAEANRQGPQRIAVCACGPYPLIKAMWDATMDRTAPGMHYDMHREVFNF